MLGLLERLDEKEEADAGSRRASALKVKANMSGMITIAIKLRFFMAFSLSR